MCGTRRKNRGCLSSHDHRAGCHPEVLRGISEFDTRSTARSFGVPQDDRARGFRADPQLRHLLVTTPSLNSTYALRSSSFLSLPPKIRKIAPLPSFTSV